MKNTIYLLLSLIILFGTACEEEEELLTECQLTKEQRYSDIEVAQFTINNSESLIQNYGHQTFPEKSRDELHPYAKLWEFSNGAGTSSTCELHFSHISFDEDDCNPELQHAVHFHFFLDQKPFETKTYEIGSSFFSTNFAYYRGILLNSDEIVRFSQNNAGTITITKYIPNSDIEGSYEINIDGVQAEGSFDFDLTRSY